MAAAGKYVVAAMRNKDAVLGKQILAAADYYVPSRIVSEFQEVTGRPARFVQIDAEEEWCSPTRREQHPAP